MTTADLCHTGLGILLCSALAACGPGTGSQARSAEPAPLGALPELGVSPIGPQPGPGRSIPEIDNPYGMGPNVLAEGRRLFVWYNCYGCHGGRGGGGMGPSLRDVFWLYGHKPEDIFSSISQGRANGMPAWGTKLPTEQIWKITAYILSMDTPKEPAAPPANPVFPNPPPGRDVLGVQAGGET